MKSFCIEDAIPQLKRNLLSGIELIETRLSIYRPCIII